MDNYKEPVEGKTYVSPQLNDFQNPERKVRIITKGIEAPESYAFATIKGETVLRLTGGNTKKIVAKLFEDNRQIFVLSIQGYNPATDKPHNASFSFVGNEITELIDFINSTQSMRFNSNRAQRISDEELEKYTFTKDQLIRLMGKDPNLLSEIIETEVTSKDIVAIAYRKKQLGIFEKLLTDTDYFESIKNKANCKVEGVWQKFFEKNTWIFGCGLGYVFLTGLDEKKLEQVVQGYSVNTHGKRSDALMKTRGILSNLCFVEIKTHRTDLLEKDAYRPGCWAVSKELAGAVAQVQGTVELASRSLSNKLSMKDTEGNPTGEEIYNYRPKSYLVIGTLEEFLTPNGANEDKLRSFELFRKSITNPEIITFDELYERARFIVRTNEK